MSNQDENDHRPILHISLNRLHFTSWNALFCDNL